MLSTVPSAHAFLCGNALENVRFYAIAISAEWVCGNVEIALVASKSGSVCEYEKSDRQWTTQVMDEHVLVIVGEWTCSEIGKWEFRVSPKQLARCVGFNEKLTFEELEFILIEEYGIDKKLVRPRLSFWYGGEGNVLTPGHMPPISISCNISLGKFKMVRQLATGLNLFVTFETIEGGGEVETREVNVEKNLIQGTQSSLDDDVLMAHYDEMEEIQKEVQNGGGKGRECLEVQGESNDVDRKGKAKVVDDDEGDLSTDYEGYEDEQEYNFDEWSDLIAREYPKNWDPYIDDAETSNRERDVVGRGQQLNRQELQLCVNSLGFSLGLDEEGETTADRQKSGGQENGRQDEHTGIRMGNVGVTGGVGVEDGGQEPIRDDLQLCVNSLRYSQVLDAYGTEREVGGGQDNGRQANQLILASVEGGTSGEAWRESEPESNLQIWDINEELSLVDCEILRGDAPPCRDNVRGLGCEIGNMDLRKAEDAIYIGRVFKNKLEFRDALALYAMKTLFHFRMKKSDKKRVVAVCVDPNCTWRISGRIDINSDNVEIIKTQLRHCCDVSYRSKYGKNATARILADLMTSKFTHGKKGPRACELPEMVLAEMNVTISYMKAWQAKEMAICRERGTEEESYRYLTTYLHLLKTTNPGTLSEVHTALGKKGETIFKYLFFAFGACVAGYKFLRKVIVIDGTSMKGRYQGCLVAASGHDGNMQIYPLAFGVVDNENEASWVWFFRRLSQIVPDEEDLVFVSDRHVAITAGLRTVYPLAHHGACSVHLFRNVKHRYKSEGLAKMVSNAARAFTIGDFKYWFKEIERRKPPCVQYLVDIGLPHWTLAYCPGKRYNVMTSNISESLNAAMVKAVDYPIVAMVEFIRTMLMRWFYLRRKHSAKTVTRCTPEVEGILLDHLAASVDCAVLSASEWVYQVNDGIGCVFEVDLEKKTCSCKVFDVLMIPCCHALAAVGVRKVDIYTLVGHCYFVEPWRKKYEQIIRPIAREADSDIPTEVHNTEINPPRTRRGGGRPRKKRIPSQGEGNGPGKKSKKTHRCSRCSATGHNKATCKNPI